MSAGTLALLVVVVAFVVFGVALVASLVPFLTRVLEAMPR